MDEIPPVDLPWWERPEVLEDPEDEEEATYANEPEQLSDETMSGVVPPPGVGNKLVHNALAIWQVITLGHVGRNLTFSLVSHTYMSCWHSVYLPSTIFTSKIQTSPRTRSNRK